MKSWKLSSGILFVFLGFFAGVGFNFLHSNTTVRAAPGAPDAPPAALKSVTHDATLKGDGTTTAPLGIAHGGVGTGQIANGAVTAPKLSAAAPSEGQVLGFNGANLAWQTPPVGGVRVVDSLGHEVGPFVQTSAVLRRISGITFLMSVSANGFQPGSFSFVHTTSDCSGPRYYYEDESQLYRGASITGAQLFYAADPRQPKQFSSGERIIPPADPNQPGICSTFSSPLTLFAGLATAIDLSTLGLFPPFSLEF